jgi:hypothetical protein
VSTPYATYYDYNSWYDTGTYSTGSLPTNGHAVPSTDTNFVMNVALILERANDPTPLLDSNWASRQQQIDALGSNIWNVYGADPTTYQSVLNDLPGSVQTVAELAQATGTPSGYVSSAESRTIWVQVNAANFNDLFGSSATLMHASDFGYYWTGSLSLPASVAGLWFDGPVKTVLPDGSSGPPAPLTTGIQGVGNGAGPTQLTPQQIAELYHFPLANLDVDTAALALLEPGLGISPPAPQPGHPQQTLQQLLENYRSSVGLDPSVNVIGVQPGGPLPTDNESLGERSLDIGVATAVNPNSALILYAGSGVNLDANSEPFTAYQAAFWDVVNNPSVVSSSFRFDALQPSPNSPFMFAVRELFIDAALRNISVFSSAGDGGSGYQVANGLENVGASRASPYGVVVGGTSLSLESYAANDPTLDAQYVVPALNGDPTVLWQLVAGGLTAMPTPGDAAWFAEAVWNRYNVSSLPGSGQPGIFQAGYLEKESGTGGVDSTQPTPWFQSALLPFDQPTTTDGTNATGRGLPDVSALAGGNMHYTVPNADMTGNTGDGGTSASAPLWASLAVQIAAIFHDQGLPSLGYMTDLLYIAAAIVPGSFNDVTIGNNVSSFLTGDGLGPYLTPSGGGGAPSSPVDPTGYGYYAGPGYDLTSGLGSPNGTLLARTLSAIGHGQMYFSTSPAVLDSDGHNGWSSGAHQSVLLQTAAGSGVAIDFDAAGDTSSFFSPASAPFAWTARFAEQALQPSFDSNLVRLFDQYAQGALGEATLNQGAGVSASINGMAANGSSTQLTGAFGFADFQTTSGDLRVARPVAIAETAGGQDDQTAVVRMRQGGADSLAASFYKVDDLVGSIGALHPGDPGYAAAAQARAYQMATGGTSFAGPGYGNYGQTMLEHVNAGDVVALQLTNVTHGETYWGFAQANEMAGGQHVGHLWNYGLNTWGWEDTRGGGDHDYNDLVVQLDFTSSSGHGWLV